MDPRPPSGPEEQIVQLALQRGLLASELVERARQACASRPGASLLVTLASAVPPATRGHLQQLQQELLRSSSSGRLAQSLASGIQAPAATQLGPYLLERELARGGMGAVWIARRPGLDRQVAVKLLLGAEPAQVERFRTEARIAARLRHPGIVAIHDVGEDQGRHYLVMDLIRGQSLQARLEAQGPLPVRLAAELGAKLARALAYAHAQAVLHRDLKPHNVLLDERGEPLLTDFGLAKDAGEDEGLTRTGQVLGTPAYMAPEQADGQPDLIDRRTDVYGMGATLFALLTGKAPFSGTNTMALIAAVITKPAPSPRSLRPELDRDLETIVLRCLEKEPDARYPSAQALADDLERWLKDEPIEARRPGPLGRLARWARRNRGLARALAASATLLLVASGVTVAALLQARLAREQSAQAERERLAATARDELLASRAGAAPVDSDALAGLAAEDLSRAVEPLLASRLQAFGAAQRWQVLAPADPAALDARLEAGLELGATATSARQWALAELAFADAAGLSHPRQAEARSGLERTRALRDEAAQARTREARRVLDRVQSGAHLAETDGLSNAVFALVRQPEQETIDEVCARLETIDEALRAATRRLYLEAQPTPSERERGWQEVAGLEPALRAWLEEGDPERGLPALRAAEALLARRARAALRADVKEQRVDPRVALSHAQEQELSARGLAEGPDLGQVCCEALGRLGRSCLERCGRLERAQRDLTGYLLVEAHPGRALRAALALIRLDVPGAARLVKLTLRLHGPDSALGAQARDVPELRRLLGGREPAAGRPAAPATNEPADELADLRQRTQTLIEAGRLDEALAGLDEAVEAAHDPAARRRRVDLRFVFLLEARRTARALELLNEELSADQGHAAWWLFRGVARRLDGDLQAARQDLERALELAPTWAEPRVQLAELLIRAEDMESASRFVDEALRLDPRSASALSARAVVRHARHDLSGALADIRQACERAPLLTEAWIRRGKMAAELGQPEEAERAFARALTLLPDQGLTWAERGHVRAISGRPAEGLADLDKAVALQPDLAQAWCSRGVALAFLDRPGEALASLDRALELDPRSGEALLHRAVLKAQARRTDEALADIDRAVEVAPRDVGIRHMRARLLLHADRPAEGWADLEEAARLAPQDATTWQLRALLCAAEGKLEQAEREFLRASEVDPESLEVQLDAALFGLEHGRLELTAAAIERAERLAPDDPELLRVRGYLRGKRGDRAGARADLERALQRAPDRPWADQVRRLLEQLRR